MLLPQSMTILKSIKSLFLKNLDLIKLIALEVIVLSLLLVNNCNSIISIAFMIVFLLPFIIKKRWNYLITAIIFALIIFVSLYCRHHISSNHYKKVLNNRSDYGEFTLKSKDILFVNVPEINNANFLECEVISYKSALNDIEQKVSGKVLLYRSELKNRFHYDDIFKVDGSIYFVDNDLILNQNKSEISTFSMGNYQRYLNSQGFYANIFPDANSYKLIKSNEYSLYRIIGNVRDFLLNKTIMNLSTKELKNISAALFYGCKGALDSNLKQTYIRSGTIHLFAISGLHVNLFCGILLILLIFIPYRIRYLIVCSLALLFVISTGANIPAMRAFIMILTWAIFKSSLINLSNINVILISAIALISFNPFYIIDIGFLYSFVITSTLLILADKLNESNEILRYKNKFLPFHINKKDNFLKLIIKVTNLILITGVAFASGSMISLSFFGNLYMISLLVNSVLIYLIPLVFCTMLIATFFNLLCLTNNIFSYFLDKLLSFFIIFSEYAANVKSNLGIGVINIFEIILFYIGLFIIFLGFKRRYFIVGLTLITISIAMICIDKMNYKSGILLIKNTNQNLVTCIYEPKINYAIVTNLESYDEVAVIAKFLSNRSIKSIDYLILNSINTRSVKALNAIDKNLQLKNVIVLNKTIRNRNKLLSMISPDVRNIIQFSRQNGIENNKIFNFSNNNDVLKLEYFNIATKFKLLLFFDKAGKIVKLKLNELEKQLEIYNSNLTEFKYYEL